MLPAHLQAPTGQPDKSAVGVTYEGGDPGFTGGGPLTGEPGPEVSVLPPLAGAAPFLGLGIRYVPLSGDPRIDGLLFDGRAWASSTITYAFPDSPTDYEYPYGAFDEPRQPGFAQVSLTQMRAITAMLEGVVQASGISGHGAIESFTQLDFVYAGTNGGDLRIAESGLPVAPAWTYLPANEPYGGDTWFVGGVPGYDFRAPVLGDYFYFGHLHELTHALGLKDAHSTGSGTPALPLEWDSMEFTVATYRSFVGSPLDGYRNETFGFPQSYMMLDIAALQYLYGADFTTRAGDTVYRWNSATGEMSVNGAGQGVPGANRVFLTIWDGGGIDTYDMSNYATPVRIDLAPGGWSVTAEAQRAALNVYDGYVLARGNVFNALQYQGDPRSLIENAIGGPAGDTISGNGAANVLDGGDGNDLLSGAAGADTLLGRLGNDVMLGGAEADLLLGLGNADTLIGGAGGDTLDGGTGFDIADYGPGSTPGATQGISVNLLTFAPTDGAFAQDAFGTFDLLFGIEGVTGTDLADVLYGTNDANLFLGLGGADQVVAWDGADTVDGGDGDDVMLGWTGGDSLLGGVGNDWLWAGDGDDTGTGGDGVDVLVGDLPGSSEIGADLLTGGLGEDILLGGAGADTLIGGADSSASSDPDARDWLVGGAGNDLVFGGADDDVIWEQLDAAEGGEDTAFGGDGNDLILVGSDADSVDGGAGNDTIYGGASADTIAGGAGNDLVWITGLPDLGDVLSDFAPGQDRLVVYPLLGGVVTTSQAFAQGILALAAAGADTLLRYDADGAGGGAAITAATFLDLSPGSFNSAADFI